MKYLIPALLLCLGLSGNLHAQETYTSSGNRLNSRVKKQEPKGFDKAKLVYGGGVSFNFFNGIFSAGVAPIVGYRFSDRFLAGVGLGYQYYSAKDYFLFNTQSGIQSYPLRRNFVYPSVWARYLVFNNIFVHAEAEYDIQNWRYYEPDADPSSPTYGNPVKRKLTINSPAVLLGAGLRQPIGEFSSLYLMALYDVIQDPNSPYLGRIDFRVGVNLGW
jgi:hypothetical protein